MEREKLINQRLEAYIDYESWNLPVSLKKIYNEAVQDEVPVIRKPVQTFLKTLLKIHKPKNILEIGAAVGFSALLMSEYTDEDTRIITIEKVPARIKKAKENISKYDKYGKIKLIEGDALQIKEELEELRQAEKAEEVESFEACDIIDKAKESEGLEEFDFIFMDAAKGQYPAMLPILLSVLKPGGILITDNILHDGDIIESRYSVNRRDRTIHSRMREYVTMLTHNEGLSTSILPIGDGISLSVKL